MNKHLLFLLLMMMPLAASARGIEVDGIFYNLNSSQKTAQVARWDWGLKYAGDFVIPSTVVRNEVEYTVTGIESKAFYDCSELTSVKIPNSVTSIGTAIFYGCTDLASIVVEEGNPTYDSRENCNAIIETASNKLIMGCKGTSIPNGITTIGQESFQGCTGLTSIAIPSSVTTIEDYAFENCTGLTSFIIPDGVTSIGSGILMGCSGLTFVYLGIGLVNIPIDMFEGCNSLKTVELNNNTIVSKNYDFNNGETNLRGIFAYSPVEEIILGEDVRSIGEYTFAGCGMLSIKMSDNVTSIGNYAFNQCPRLTSVELSNNLTYIGQWAFTMCSHLSSVTIPKSVRCIDQIAFYWCNELTKVVINSNEVVARENEQFHTLTSCFGPQVKEFVLGEDVRKIAYIACSESEDLTTVTLSSNLTCIEDSAFHKCTSIADVYCYAEQVPEMGKDVFVDSNYKNATLHVPANAVEAYKSAEQWKDFGSIVALPVHDAYRPFVEEGKVWKVGSTTGITDGIVQVVDYYYFDGDTIIDGKNCKQMMRQRYVSPDLPDYSPSLTKVGAWYEEGKKVYFYDPTTNQFKLMYDFSLGDNETLQINNNLYVVGPKQTGEMKGFKGVYRDVMMKWDEEESIYNTSWLEGVGGIDGPTVSVYLGEENHVLFLMSCTVGEEVIYFNDEYEDGTTTGDLEAKKHRFDFTHTIKTRPKAPIKRVKSNACIGSSEREVARPKVKAPKRREVERQQDAEMQSLYGEYNERQLGINLNPLDDAYIVRIANESGNVVYEKAINAGSIVALDIDISAYAKGRYTVTVENSSESFSGEFDTQTTGIIATTNKKEEIHYIYNLQGQRLSSLQKGLNIVDGRKIIVK